VEENVPPNSRTIEDYNFIKDQAKNFGYRTQIDIVDAACLGGAQSRLRTILLTTKSEILTPVWDVLNVSGMSTTPRPLRDILLSPPATSKAQRLRHPGLKDPDKEERKWETRTWIPSSPNFLKSPTFASCHELYHKAGTRLHTSISPHLYYKLGILISRNSSTTTVLEFQLNLTTPSGALEKPSGVYTFIQLVNLFNNSGIRCSTPGLHQSSASDYSKFPVDVNQSERPITGHRLSVPRLL